MEQNENIMDNNFENFEEQGKYKSIRDERETKGERYAILVEKTLLISYMVFCFGVIFPFIFIQYEWKYYVMIIPAAIATIVYMMSIIYTVWGRKIANVKKTKDMVRFHIIVSGTTIAATVIMLAISFIFWRAFGGFASEKITFWEWFFMQT